MAKNQNAGLIKKSIFISMIVCLGKIMGFFKQAVIAWAFGANSITDIYFTADSYIAMFGQIQIASIAPSVITIYVKLKEKKRSDKAEDLLRSCYTFFPVIAITLIIINIVFSGQICRVLGLSYSDTQRTELQWFLIALCPVILFTSYIGLAQGVLDSHERFFPSKLLSLFFSTSIIIFIFLFHKILGIKSMLIGFLIGYMLHTIYVTILSIRYFKPKISNPFGNPDFKLVLHNFFPLIIGNSIVDLGHLLDKIIASALDEGSVSVLYYGQVISSDIVNAVIITTIGTVLLPSLTRMVSKEIEKQQLSYKLNSILCTMLMLTAIITGLYVVEGRDLVKIFFERGSFTSDSTDKVSLTAICYAISFIFIATREVLVKMHYAFQDTLGPMKNGIVGVIINVFLSIALSRFFGVSGIALATSVSMIIVTVLMCFSLSKHLDSFPVNRQSMIDLLKISIVSVAVVILGVLIKMYLKESAVLLRLIFVSSFMVVFYITLLILIKQSTVHEAYKKIRKR